MSQKKFSLISSFIFLVIGMLHIGRILYGANVVAGGVAFPMWLSGVGAIVFFALAYFGFKINRSLA